MGSELVAQSFVQLGLKTSNDGDWPTSSGNLCHCSALLRGKKIGFFFFSLLHPA